MTIFTFLGAIAIVGLIGFAVWSIFSSEVPTEEQRRHDAIAFDKNRPAAGKQGIINRGGSAWSNLVSRIGRRKAR